MVTRKEIKLLIGSNVIQTGESYDWDLLSLVGEDAMDYEITLEQLSSDGAYTKNARFLPRYIYLVIKSKDRTDALIDARYIQSTDYFDNTQDCILTVYSHGIERDIPCRLESRENLSKKWHESPHFRLILVAEAPWMRSAEITNTFSSSLGLMFFPLTFTSIGMTTGVATSGNSVTFDYNGQVETGFTLTFTATGAVVNPKITNQNGDYVRVLKTMASGDIVTVSTVFRQKGIRCAGVACKYDRLSTFFSLEKGENTLTVSADSGLTNLSKSIVYRELYRGI